jgi:hypothetical protein
VTDYVEERVEDAKLVLFSDDIANVCEDNDKLQLIYW